MDKKELIEKKNKIEADWNQLQNQRQFLERQLQETNRQLLLHQRREMFEGQIGEIDRQLSVLRNEFLELEKSKKVEEVKKEKNDKVV